MSWFFRAMVIVGALSIGMPAFGSGPEAVDGWGRITVSGGYRWVPNWYFEGKASTAGTPYTSKAMGGVAGILGFGYGLGDHIEIGIDLFGAWHPFSLGALGAFDGIAYGGMLGVRLTGSNAIFTGLMPYFGAQGGIVLADVQGGTVDVREKLMGGAAVMAGLHYKVSDHWGVTLDVRWVWARLTFPTIGGMNSGGVWVTLGVSYFISPARQQSQGVPGFDGPSYLRD